MYFPVIKSTKWILTQGCSTFKSVSNYEVEWMFINKTVFIYRPLSCGFNSW